MSCLGQRTDDDEDDAPPRTARQYIYTNQSPLQTFQRANLVAFRLYLRNFGNVMS
jgi:hypothetical protein